MPPKFHFPLSIDPIPGEKYCRYPYMYVDINKSGDRRKYFVDKKYPVIKDYIQPSYFCSQDTFRALLTRIVNDEELDKKNQITIYFALDDGNLFTFIFSIMSLAQSKKLFFILIDDGKNYKELDLATADKWKQNYVNVMLHKLDPTLYHDPAHLKDSPTDTTSIDYDLFGLCQLDREIDYQKNKNNVQSILGISIFFTSCMTPNTEIRKEFTCFPQRLITEFGIMVGSPGNMTEFEISTMPDFNDGVDSRKEEVRDPTWFDTGNICPPRC